MPRISRQLSSKKSSINKRFATVAVAALFFYNAQVFIELHQTTSLEICLQIPLNINCMATLSSLAVLLSSETTRQQFPIALILI